MHDEHYERRLLRLNTQYLEDCDSDITQGFPQLVYSKT